jgi:threonine/homoserine/homoserine lactone efflux protein
LAYAGLYAKLHLFSNGTFDAGKVFVEILFLEGLVIGFVIAVPVGPIGLLCVNRALSRGSVYGLVSGLGVATADAISAGIAALGVTLVSTFLTSQQKWLHLIGGVFFCCLGLRIFLIRPGAQATTINKENGLVGAYASTFFLNMSNPVTILSFVAIYAGWGVESLSGDYTSAALLTLGIFFGSALWWVLLDGALLIFREKFTHHGLRWTHRISGAIIAGFGCFILLSLYY